MKSNARGTSLRSARALIAVALAVTMLTGGSAVSSGGDKVGRSAASSSGDTKSVFVSGNSTLSDCGLRESDFALAMTGDLRGCLSVFIQDHKCWELEDFDLYFEKGREVFVGKYHGKQGSFRTTYTFDGVYAKGFCQSFDPTLEVGGGCRHKVMDGSRVFADAEGLIKFIDVIAGVTGDPVTGEFQAGTGGNNFPYYGRIDLDQHH